MERMEIPFFLDFAGQLQPQSVLRAAITAACRRPESEALAPLLSAARLAPAQAAAAHTLAVSLARRLRERATGGSREGLVPGLMREFSLSSQEGVALMCLAEALLRIPDTATRDALIRDKLGEGDWAAHLGRSGSKFVNAAAWGLLLGGRMVQNNGETGLRHALNRVLARSGEPLLRKGVDLAMRLLGEQFVCGQTIGEALSRARRRESQGFTYSFDMLGEAALTQEDAQRYTAAYEHAIHALGIALAGRGLLEGPGISIKLSALHPRYCRAQHGRVMDELYPRLLHLALLAQHHGIALNLDAEEADRLELSLDLLQRLCGETALAGWNGLGLAVQAYQKRSPHVIDFCIDLARRSRRRLMLRLVKGAYWDSEIKRAQVDGLEDYAVFTRKAHTDVAYLACARRMLAAPEAVYPQFATHNAHTVAALVQMAGDWAPGRYEFQCLHGMGEPLYEMVVPPMSEGGLGRPCRIYAPVGTHETLLAYLVRRLLENGANTSFVNRIADASVAVDTLVADPVALVERAAQAEGAAGLPHAAIPLPRDLFGGQRLNACGVDLANEHRLASLAAGLLHGVRRDWSAAPLVAGQPRPGDLPQPVLNPADRRDRVGTVHEARPEEVKEALDAAAAVQPAWGDTPPAQRADLLERAADALEDQLQWLVGLIVREAGKTVPAAVGEVREAVDALRYAALQARTALGEGALPLGPIACISPWNFPLAIFTGQLAAALAAGNAVICKPARQTPLVAAEMVKLLHAAGVPGAALQLLPGSGEAVGMALASDERVRGVLFTGSTTVARRLREVLAGRLDAQGAPPLLVAETGGLNAMLVDSSALAEQVVADVLASAFDSAGQRCSALRVLCLQQEVAERVLHMLLGAMAELRVGRPDALSTDVGPVIDEAARAGVEKHVERMRALGLRVTRAALDESLQANGSFVQPTVIELDDWSQLPGEVFGPVLHVLRWRRDGLEDLLKHIEATGYGLTLGLHTRIDETMALVTSRARVGNQYVNRNMIGAVVGVQPFGGEGLSGTGPKAGGPLLVRRLCARHALALPAPGPVAQAGVAAPAPRLLPLRLLRGWLADGKAPDEAPNEALRAACDALLSDSPAGLSALLPGPTGERNVYSLLPRRRVLCQASARGDLLFLLALVLATDAQVLCADSALTRELLAALPQPVRERVALSREALAADVDFAVALDVPDRVLALNQALARRAGAIVPLLAGAPGLRDVACMPPERLMVERSVCVNTAAAGGNVGLMAMR
ncbi:trifunctional transcriptional regulator/proline dehydrogenase/L-glutamate gamma-semialdehyde dehydrogenase [Azohydromonas lata]|uniref:Bifunctional protein PutA n=2 Tax=Azohydromonas lata TaxID=45677 RepID=A0ABU5IHF6_9BURK|nr:trifunctional transcriptional regulator/proline dehydrogenase/L-glutamate gamma-semialdehyde dehydrogenase [Azohydromonas lata]MDZ5458214.1 trifunctional transcriptional regulator/proline dehydrogenase/L-glutamate gamma-semialdehyde dehydrogenase [Azohydromonas lata]